MNKIRVTIFIKIKKNGRYLRAIKHDYKFNTHNEAINFGKRVVKTLHECRIFRSPVWYSINTKLKPEIIIL